MNPINIPVETKTVTLTKEQFEFLNWALYYGRAVSRNWFPVKIVPRYEKIEWANALFNSALVSLYDAFRKITPADSTSLTIPTFYTPFILALLYGIEEIQIDLIEQDIAIEYPDVKAENNDIRSDDFVSQEKSKRIKSSEFIKEISRIFDRK